MDVRIQAIHFEIADRLVEFINKKADRLARSFPSMTAVDVNLKVVKPETAMNKEVADSFEEAFDLAAEAVERQLEKNKEKK